MPGDADLDSYVTMVQQYAKDKGLATSSTPALPAESGNLLTVTKFINEIGAANVTPDSMRPAAKGSPARCGVLSVR